MEYNSPYCLQTLEKRLLLSADGLPAGLNPIPGHGPETEVVDHLETVARPTSHPDPVERFSSAFGGAPDARLEDILSDLDSMPIVEEYAEGSNPIPDFVLETESKEDQTRLVSDKVRDRVVAFNRVSQSSNQESASMPDYIFDRLGQAVQDEAFTETLSPTSDLGIPGVLRIQNPALAFNAVYNSNTGSWEGSVSITGSGASLFPGSDVEATVSDAPLGETGHDGSALSASYNLSSKTLTLTADTLDMGLGTFATVRASGASLVHQPLENGDKTFLGMAGVNVFVGSSDESVGVSMENGSLALLYLTDESSQTSSYALSASGLGSLSGFDSALDLSGALSIQSNTTGSGVSESISVGGTEIDLSISDGVSGFALEGDEVSLVIVQPGITLTGDFSFTKVDEKLLIGVENLSGFFGADDRSFGIQMDSGTAGLVLFKNAQGEGSHVVVAKADLSLAGLAFVDVTGEVGVWINETGESVVEESVGVDFAGVESISRVSAENLTLGFGGYVTIGADVLFSKQDGEMEAAFSPLTMSLGDGSTELVGISAEGSFGFGGARGFHILETQAIAGVSFFGEDITSLLSRNPEGRARQLSAANPAQVRFGALTLDNPGVSLDTFELSGPVLSVEIRVTVANATFGASGEATNMEGSFRINGSIENPDAQVRFESFKADDLKVDFGGVLSFEVTNPDVSPTNRADQPYFSFTEASVTLPLGDSGVSLKGGIGSDTGVIIYGDGRVVPGDGFWVSIATDTDSDTVKWPSWLPVNITEFKAEWTDILDHPTDLSLTMSADVTGIQGLSEMQVSGSVTDLQFDFERLKQGKFAITEIGSLSVGIKGELFGGELDAGLILGLVKVDSGWNILDEDADPSEVHEWVLYGGIEGGFNFSGLAGLNLHLGLSDLGPLNFFFEADIPILLDPDTGFSITGIRAGVEFDVSLPTVDPTNPLELNSSLFQPAQDMTTDQWLELMQQQVVNQVKDTADGESAWDVFDKPMIIQGGATFFSEYASQEAFKADIDLLMDTTGTFLINARAVYGDALSMNTRFYFARTATGLEDTEGNPLYDVEIAVLIQDPVEVPLLTIAGGFGMTFLDAGGQQAGQNKNDPAVAVRYEITGYLEMTADEIEGLDFNGDLSLTFTATTIEVDLDVTVKDETGAELLEAAGSMVIEILPDSTEAWGVLALTTPFQGLSDSGVSLDGNVSGQVSLNTTSRDIVMSLKLPDDTEAENYTLKAESFRIILTGFFSFKLEGKDWFKMKGEMDLEIDSSGFLAFLEVELRTGDWDNPLMSFEADGLMVFRENGFAAKLILKIKSDSPQQGDLSFDGEFLLQLNSTGKSIRYTIPDELDPVEGSRSVVITAEAPGSESVSSYLYIKVTGSGGDGDATLNLAGDFELSGTFELRVGADEMDIKASGSMDLKAGSTVLFQFDFDGEFNFSHAGVLAVVDLTLAGSNASGHGFSGSTDFRLQVNTTGSDHKVDDVELKAGDIAKVHAEGTLSVSSFSFEGTFDLTIASDHVIMTAEAHFEVFSTRLSLSGMLAAYHDGLAFSLTIAEKGIKTSFMDLSGGFSIQVNTSARTIDGISPHTYLVRITGAKLTIAKLTLSGSLSIGIVDDLFEISIPSSDPLSVEFGSVFSFSLSGYIKANGSYDITGSTSISLGNAAYVQLNATAKVTIRSSGTVFSGTISGSLKVFNHSVAGATGSFSSNGAFTVTAYVDISANDYLTLKSNLTLSRSSSGVLTASFTGTVKAWDFFSVQASGYIHSDGNWSFKGTSTTSVGNGNLGAKLTLSMDVGNKSAGLFISGSAWAGIKIVGIHVGASGSVSGAISTSGRVDAKVSACVHFLGTHCASVTVHIDFSRGGKVWLSEVGGATVFLDVNLNGLLDEDEPWTTTDENGYYDFADLDSSSSGTIGVIDRLDENGNPIDPVLGSLASYDTDSDGMISEGEGILFLKGGRSLTDGSPNANLVQFDQVRAEYKTNYAAASVFLDLNGNRRIDPNEPSTTSNSIGVYSFIGAVEPRSEEHLGLLALYDLNRDGLLNPDEGTLMVSGGNLIDTGDPNESVEAMPNELIVGYAPYANAILFFDANTNGTREADEVSVTSDHNGFFSFINLDNSRLEGLGRLSPFDVNGNGVIDPDEGVLVTFQGVDNQTGLAVAESHSGLATSMGTGFMQTLNPMTSVHYQLLQDSGLSDEEVDTLLVDLLGLDENVDVNRYDPGSQVDEAAVGYAQVLSIATQFSVLKHASGSLVASLKSGLASNNLQVLLDSALSDLIHGQSDQVSRFQAQDDGTVTSDAEISFNDIEVVADYLHRVLAATSITADPDLMDAMAVVVSNINARIDFLAAQNLENLDSGLAKVKHMTYAELSGFLADVLIGSLTTGDWVDQFSGQNLVELSLNRILPVANDHPVIQSSDHYIVTRGTGLLEIPIQINDPNDAVSEVMLSVTASETNLFESGPIDIRREGEVNYVVVTLDTTQTGWAVFQVTAKDQHPDQGDTIRAFTLHVIDDSEGVVEAILQSSGADLVEVSIAVQRVIGNSGSAEVDYTTEFIGSDGGGLKPGTVAFEPDQELAWLTTSLLPDSSEEIKLHLVLGSADQTLLTPGELVLSLVTSPTTFLPPTDQFVSPGDGMALDFYFNDPLMVNGHMDVDIESSHPGIVESSAVRWVLSGNRGTLFISTQAGVYGSTKITLTLNNGVVSRSGEFTITTDLVIRGFSSLATHGPENLEYGLPIHDDGTFTESRQGGIQKIMLEFSQPVSGDSFPPSAVGIAGIKDSDYTVVDLSSLEVRTALSGDGTLGTIEFNQALPDQARYYLQINGVRSQEGNLLTGGSHRVFSTLQGDTNGDGWVNNIDVSRLIWHMGENLEAGAGDPTALSRADINRDGMVDFKDVDALLPLRGNEITRVPIPDSTQLNSEDPIPARVSQRIEITAPKRNSMVSTRILPLISHPAMKFERLLVRIDSSGQEGTTSKGGF